MKIRVLLLILLCSLPLMLSAQNDISADFERELVLKGSVIECIDCDFIQTRSMAILAQDVVKEGVFAYSRPGNISLEFHDGDYIRMTDTSFSMKNAGHVTQVNVNSNPMLKELKKILSASMTGDVASMTAGFVSEIQLDGDSYSVRLIPKKGKGAAKVKEIKMLFDRKDMSLAMLMLVEQSGDYIRYDFVNKKFRYDS